MNEKFEKLKSKIKNNADPIITVALATIALTSITLYARSQKRFNNLTSLEWNLSWVPEIKETMEDGTEIWIAFLDGHPAFKIERNTK